MKKLYVIGNPIKHSLSPKIFKYWFKKYKIRCSYEKIQTSPKGFEKKIFKIIKQGECLGANITTPFKKTALRVIDKKDKHAKKIGAVNCIYKKNKKIIGTNTDWQGFVAALKHVKQIKKTNTKKQQAAIIGFGGATRGIIYALKKIGYKKILVFVRNKEKFVEIKKFDKKIIPKKLQDINTHAKNFDLLINSTTTSKVNQLKINPSFLKKTSIVFDLNYNQHKTDLIKKAKKNKNKVVYGIYMLVFQAAPSFKYWFGFSPTITKKLIAECIKEINK